MQAFIEAGNKAIQAAKKAEKYVTGKKSALHLQQKPSFTRLISIYAAGK
jgi:hypothetical protein